MKGSRVAREDRVAVSVQRRRIDGQPCTMLEVEHVESGEVVLRCTIGDDLGAERMADFLSAKRYPQAAARVRQLVREARRMIR